MDADAGYTVGTPSNDTVTIDDNDASVTISATDATAHEEGLGTGTFQVTRFGELDGALTVNYSVTGTAVNGTDYTTLGGTVVIADTNASADITITPVDDPDVEGNETVIVTLTSGTGYYVETPSSDTVTIVDNEPVVSISATDATADEEGPTTGTFTVSRAGSTDNAITVNYSVTGTAVNGTDYTTLGGSVVIAASSASSTITITPVDDSDVEGDETVIVTLASGTGYTVGTPTNDTVTIADNEPVVSISATDATATEASTTTGTFTVTRTGDTTNAITVNYSVTGTAVNGADYTTVGSSVVIAAASSSSTVTITPVDDTVAEGDETVILTLTSGTGYALGTPIIDTVTITDDDAAYLEVLLKMDESSGTIAYDVTANDNDAAVTNATFVSGKGGNALDFDGTGDYADIANSASVTIDDNITIAFWVNGAAQPGYHRLVANKTPSGGDGFEINVQSGTDDVTFGVSTSGGSSQTFRIYDVLDSTWHHLAYTLNNGTIGTYLDGSQVTSLGTSYTHGDGFGNSNDWVLAADVNHNQEFDGMLDDFRLYSTALSASEISDLYDDVAQ